MLDKIISSVPKQLLWLKMDNKVYLKANVSGILSTEEVLKGNNQEMNQYLKSEWLSRIL